MSLPVEYIVPVQHDAFMADYVPDSELGTLAYLRCGWETGKVPAATRPLMRFSLVDVPSDFRTIEAELWANCTTAAAAAVQADIYSLLVPEGFTYPSEAWVEDEVTWNDYKTATGWGTPGGDYTLNIGSFYLPTTTGNFKLLDGTTLVEIVEYGRSLGAPRVNLLARRTLEGFTSAQIRIASREAGGSPAGPWLILRGYQRTVHLVGGVHLVGNTTVASG